MNAGPMNLILGLFVFALTFSVSAMRNVATAFALVFIPALLFFRPVYGYKMPGGLPELRMSNAAVLGLMAGMLFHLGRQGKIRWSPVDLVVLLAPLAAIISAIQTENWHTGYDELLKQLFLWSIPYFVARYSFQSEDFRKKMLWTLILCMLVLGVFAAIEFRMAPHFFAQTLGKTGLKVGFNTQAVRRGAFFRAETSFEHPIFFGDGCVSICCLILMLASTLKGGWLRPTVLLGAATAVGGLFTSLSFGPYLGMAIAGGIWFLLRFVGFTRAYVVCAGVLCAIIGLVMLTSFLARTEIPTRPKNGSVYDSFLVRWEIVQKCAPFAQQVLDDHPFGIGKPGIAELNYKGKPVLDLESVDNAYMLFLIVRGYIYSGMWAVIPLLVSFRACMVLHRNKRKEFIFPIAIGAGSSIGISFAFYFVWAGWNPEPYTILWLTATAFTMAACDVCVNRMKADAAGYPALPAGNQQVLAPMPYPYANAARARV
jgi:hypothetical protein